ncbi:hypothetical protein P691DRAFT_785352 [Macrolepiota fuliginosa MF-IS2]|uniref:Uncharacterized protein n=1 Tax=Macrolepiota fuliginosa MF-IS2 TaxID=1400762 RepID=A0A9P6BYM4_9AGAR|nr:hypothetical protein P691DRAFT_785352 [Macrolepiota fuliginosa MF-IS2]
MAMWSIAGMGAVGTIGAEDGNNVNIRGDIMKHPIRPSLEKLRDLSLLPRFHSQRKLRSRFASGGGGDDPHGEESRRYNPQIGSLALKATLHVGLVVSPDQKVETSATSSDRRKGFCITSGKYDMRARWNGSGKDRAT